MTKFENNFSFPLLAKMFLTGWINKDQFCSSRHRLQNFVLTMLNREVPGKCFLTLGPSRVVIPIDTTGSKITRHWSSTPSDSWSETSHSNITVIAYLANVPWVTLIKHAIWFDYFSLSFAQIFYMANLKHVVRFSATASLLPPPFFSPLLSYTDSVGNVTPLVTPFWLKEGSVF